MTNSGLVKVFGWGQFVFNTLSNALAGGIPHTVTQWLAFLGSLAMAIGVHSASNTDGAK